LLLFYLLAADVLIHYRLRWMRNVSPSMETSR
jgi:hypothetical protein